LNHPNKMNLTCNGSAGVVQVLGVLFW
jgi:hypothetical protein